MPQCHQDQKPGSISKKCLIFRRLERSDKLSVVKTFEPMKIQSYLMQTPNFSCRLSLTQQHIRTLTLFKKHQDKVSTFDNITRFSIFFFNLKKEQSDLYDPVINTKKGPERASLLFSQYGGHKRRLR